MATNRTKIDWAYSQAKRFFVDRAFHDKQDQIRAFAAALRRAYHKGEDDMRDTIRDDELGVHNDY